MSPRSRLQHASAATWPSGPRTAVVLSTPIRLRRPSSAYGKGNRAFRLTLSGRPFLEVANRSAMPWTTTESCVRNAPAQRSPGVPSSRKGFESQPGGTASQTSFCW